MRTVSLIANGIPALSPLHSELIVWQSNAVTFAVELEASFPLRDDTAELVLEIHTSKSPGGAAPLAAKTVAVADPATETSWDFEFTTEEMGFSIGSGKASAERYLFITARDSGGGELQTVAARRIRIYAAGYSGVVPDPPQGALVNSGAYYTLTLSGVTANLQPYDADLSALAALSGTNTIYYRSAANTWSAVTIGSGLTFSGGTLSASGGGGGGGGGTWGSITGTLSSQTDLQSALDAKAPLTTSGLVYGTAAVGDGVTDDRGAIQTALDTAAAAAALTGGRATVRLERGKIYALTPILFVPTSGSSRYGCIAIPEAVTLDLNGSKLLAVYSGADPTDGAVIFPKNLPTAASNFGAAGNWCVRNGRVESSALEERTGNLIVVSRCENVLLEDLYLGQRLYHGLEIQVCRNVVIRRVRINGDCGTNHPEIQFDYNGNAAICTNAAFTPTAAMENILMEDVTIEGFQPTGSGQTRRVEMGHSGGVHRNIVMSRCRFDGIYGDASGNTSDSRHIMEIGNGSVAQDHFENIVVRDSYFNHDCISPDSSCIVSGASTATRINNLLIENCWLTGVYSAGISIGSTDFAVSPLGTGPGCRRNIVLRNNTAAMGKWSSQESGGTYDAQPAATQTTGSRAFGFSIGKCESVTLENNRAILPAAFGDGISATLRSYYGFWLMNNQSTVGRGNSVEFWHTIGAANTPSAGYFNGLRVDCDEVVNTLALPCHYSMDGFIANAREIGGITAATDDTFTKTAHGLVDDEPVQIEYSGSLGSGFTTGQTKFVRNATADTFKLGDSAGGAALDVTSSNTTVVVRKARLYNYAYEEDAISSGAEVRLTGQRLGIIARAPASVATAADPIIERMVLNQPDDETVTNAKLANMATARIKGRTTAGTGDPEDLTGTEVTAMLDAFTSGAKGLAPASGGGTSNFLRADGSWAAPAGGGDMLAANNLSDLVSASTARTNLGLGTLATVSPTGTPDGSKFLRDDNSWQTVSGSGDVTAASSFGTDNRIIRSDGTGKGVQSSAWTIADTGAMTGSASIVANYLFEATNTGAGYGVLGSGNIGLDGYNNTTAGFGVFGATSLSGGVGVMAATEHASGVSLALRNSGGFDASVTFAGTANRTWQVPDDTATPNIVASQGWVTAGFAQAFADQDANLIFAGPSTGGADAPSFRALVTADMPSSVVTLTGSQQLTNKELGAGTSVALGSDATGDIWYRNSGAAMTRLAAGSAGQRLKISSGLPAWTDEIVQVGFTADGGGSALSAGKIKGYVVVPFAATIVGWSITADAGTATVKVWKIATGTAVPTISNAINTSGVSLSTGTHVRSSTTSDFTTTAVAAGDILAFDLTAVATATELTFNLELKKS